MLRLASDENFDADIVRGLRQRVAGLDLLTIQGAGLSGAADPVVLQWAAGERRVLLTYDRATLIGHAWDRVRAGLPMAGAVAIAQDVATAVVIEALELLVGASRDDE